MRTFRNSLIILTVVLAVSFFFMKDQEQQALLFLSGAGMKVPVTEIAENYERETGIRIETQFEGSSILRDYIINFENGDIFLPGDKKNIDVLSEKGLVAESSFIAWHVVAILVSPEAHERIKGLDDLIVPGVRLAISNPKLASLGRIVMQQIIEKHPQGPDILNNVVIYGSSSQDILKLYREGGIDAIIEWDVMASTPEGEGLIVVPLEAPYQVKDKLFAGLLNTAKDPAIARKFYEYLTSDGKEIFRKHGYDIKNL